MTLFDQYTFIENKLPDTPLSGIQSCNGLAELNDMVANLRKTELPVLICEDGSDLSINLSDRPGRGQHLMFYVIFKGSQTDSQKRMKAYQDAYEAGLQILKLIKQAFREEEFGIASSMEEDNINAIRVGPLPLDGYGYGFSYTVNPK